MHPDPAIPGGSPLGPNLWRPGSQDSSRDSDSQGSGGAGPSAVEFDSLRERSWVGRPVEEDSSQRGVRRGLQQAGAGAAGSLQINDPYFLNGSQWFLGTLGMAQAWTAGTGVGACGLVAGNEA